jgi:serine/threonine protein kinase
MTTVNQLSAALGDRYRIERELGAGGMATVFLATDLKHDRPVAVNVLKADLAAELGTERFLQETRLRLWCHGTSSTGSTAVERGRPVRQASGRLYVAALRRSARNRQALAPSAR